MVSPSKHIKEVSLAKKPKELEEAQQKHMVQQNEPLQEIQGSTIVATTIAYVKVPLPDKEKDSTMQANEGFDHDINMVSSKRHTHSNLQIQKHVTTNEVRSQLPINAFYIPRQMVVAGSTRYLLVLNMNGLLSEGTQLSRDKKWKPLILGVKCGKRLVSL